MAAFRSQRHVCIDAVFGGSPFLRDLILRDPRIRWPHILGSDPRELLDSSSPASPAEAGDEQAMRRLLRRSRARAAMTIALADIGGAWSLDQVTGALTRFAEAALQAALNWLLREARAPASSTPR